MEKINANERKEYVDDTGGGGASPRQEQDVSGVSKTGQLWFYAIAFAVAVGVLLLVYFN